MKRNKFMLWVLFLALAFCLSGVTALLGEQLPEYTKLGKYKKDPPYRIGCSGHYGGIPWIVQWEEEFKDECQLYKDAGIISKYFYTSAMGDVSKQINDIEDLLARGIDALLVGPASPTALIPVLDKVYDEGIPVIIIGQFYEGDKYSGYRMVDNREFGKVGAEWLVEKITEKKGRPAGNIIALRGGAGHGPDIERYELGAKPVFDKYPGIKVVGEVYADWAYDKALSATENLLAANRQIDGVWTCGGQMTLAALHAFQRAGRPLVPMSGEDYNGLLKAWITYKDDGFDTIAPSNPVWMTKVGVQLAINLLRGQTVKRKIVYDCPFIDWEEVNKYVRYDLPDHIWANATLSDKKLKKVFKIK